RRHPRNSRRLALFWGLLVAGLALLLIGRTALSFLIGWEVMALSAFFLVSTEDETIEARKAGLIYIVSTHIGTLLLFGAFALWRRETGSFDLVPLVPGETGFGAMTLLFLVFLFAFALKAGAMPFHFWLPGAHAAAPSHVSAMLSGVVLKMGIYGILRFLSLVPDPPAFWGWIILALGIASGILGVAFAIAQHDLKRLLAYHSVENVGIILMGAGLASLGRSYGRPELVVLGLAGCLLHVWNHSAFKALLFLGAGSVVTATGTRAIDELGGLAKKMPWTAAFFLIGAVAICGLPPLNGFVSEFLVYAGLFRAISEGGAAASAAIAAPALAMIGALAVACFVKVYGATFLGSPRGHRPERARESGLAMLAPMALLSAACAFIGLAPALFGPMLESVVAEWSGGGGLPSLAALVPLGTLGAGSIALALSVAALFALGSIRRRRAAVTWDCGYARPTSRMQYTASSFASSVVGLFGWALRPRTKAPKIEGAFPCASAMASHVDDAVLDRFLLPSFRRAVAKCGALLRFQHGLTQSYILYILVAAALLLATLIPYKELLASLSARGR
ncbi:MAG: proton-conducting transporter membrane subunit, partial [Spirochaetaceae bacterium]|nr:proton-conducting transporter membrane subunit [Spirochaetaceae bacterium]